MLFPNHQRACRQELLRRPVLPPLAPPAQAHTGSRPCSPSAHSGRSAQRATTRPPRPGHQAACTASPLASHTWFNLPEPRAFHRCRCHQIVSVCARGSSRGRVKKTVAWSLEQSRCSTKVSLFLPFLESKTKVCCGVGHVFSHSLWQT